MSRIKEILNEDNSVLVFDVDGVLALCEFGERNHFVTENDDEWINAINEGIEFYKEDKVSKKMQQFLSKKDMDRIYVITTVENGKEGETKRIFANKFYNIKLENVYYVEKDSQKTEKLIEIRKKHPDIDDEHIVMIDDTVNILNDVMEKTSFSTAHISSFLDI